VVESAGSLSTRGRDPGLDADAPSGVVYFKDVNASFAAGTIALDRVPAALAGWSFWQWVRTAIGTGAFVSALAAVRSHDG
jgi:hypothetical protein